MNIYELSTSEQIDIDDLLDLSNDELFSSTNIEQSPETPFNVASAAASSAATTVDFTRDICLPSDDDVAELEWLSRFVEDSFTDVPSYSLNPKNDHSSFLSKARSKRSRVAPLNGTNWTTTMISDTKREIMQREAYPAASALGRRCSHCSSDKTPQWRTGPLGPKTLCNACGVRYKSGRLVPEYRPAASPTFVPTRHSNSHRKVMELRRQKEEEDGEQVHRQHHHRQRRDFENNNMKIGLKNRSVVVVMQAKPGSMKEESIVVGDVKHKKGKKGSGVSVTWNVPRKKHGEKNPGLNLDYSPPKTHPPSHN